MARRNGVSSLFTTFCEWGGSTPPAGKNQNKKEEAPMEDPCRTCPDDHTPFFNPKCEHCPKYGKHLLFQKLEAELEEERSRAQEDDE